MSQRNITEIGAWSWHQGGRRTIWDALRKDVDLWEDSGDCLVYLYERGGSRRPASIRVSISKLRQAKCAKLLTMAIIDTSSSFSSSPSPTQISPYDGQTLPIAELYLGAPKHLGREETFRWHLTTRNFFAWLLHKPLAGHSLGLAMSDLLDRMVLYRSQGSNNLEDLLDFADDMAYFDLANQPDIAVAALVFAEAQKLRDMWINAFVHCVGMNDLTLESSPDFETLGIINKTLITKAALKMEIELREKANAIDNFMEADFLAVGLTDSARQHLDDFRSFLQAYFVSTYGYWPPRRDGFSKELYSSLAEDLQSLYNLLADFRSSDESPKAATGGLCVLQNLESFDSRHGFAPLETSLPLLPLYEPSKDHRKHANRALRSFSSRKGNKITTLARARAALTDACNSHDMSQSSLVQAFQKFEYDTAHSSYTERSSTDARKVRWMLVYAMLQMLQSVLRSPKEVNNSQEASYPLFCITLGLPSWDYAETSSFNLQRPLKADTILHSKESRNSALSVHPDGETDYNTYCSIRRELLEHGTPSYLALRRLIPVRTKSLNIGLSRTRLSRLISSTIVSPFASASSSRGETVSVTSDDDGGSPSSTAPSLDWSHESRSSHDSSSHEELPRLSSKTSSIYSDKPEPPTKSISRGDVLDKGLAYEDFICPGLDC